MNKIDYELESMLQDLEDLYDKSPEQFEQLRRKIIRKSINSYPESFRHRAKGIQFKLDCELGKYKHPVARMNRMVELFWGKVTEFQSVLSDPASFSSEQNRSKQKAKVIPLF